MKINQVLPGHDLGLAATRFHRLMRTGVDAALAPFGLSGTEYGALGYLDEHDNTSNADLARFLIVTPQALGRVTARLRDAGLLARLADAGAGRRQTWALTPEGSSVLAAAKPAVELSQEALLAPLTNEERVALHRALDACTNSTISSRQDATP